MTPEQIKQWQDEHGGLDGDPSPPDSRGLVTYRASDGAWVVVGKNGQLVSRGSKPGVIDEKGPGYTEPGQTPAAAPSSGVGATTQAEIEARVAKNPNLVYRGQTLKTKTIPGLPGLGDKQIQVPVVSWVDPATGQTLTAEIGEGGAYTVTEDGIVPGNKGPASQTTGEWRTEGTPDGRGGFDNSRPIMVRTVNGKREERQPTGAELKDWNVAQQMSRNPGGKTDADIAAEKAKDDATVSDVAYTGTGKGRQKVTTYKSGRKATEAAPTNATATSATYETRDGKPVKVTKYDDGTEALEEQKPTPGQVIKGGGANGEDVQAIVDPKTGQISYQPITGAVGNKPVPPKIATFVPDINQPAYGALTYQRDVFAAEAAGQITSTQREELLTRAHQTATSYGAQHQNAVTDAQTAWTDLANARNQQAAEQQNRSVLSNSILDSATKTGLEISKYAKQGSGSAVTPYLMQGLGMQAAMYRDLPPVAVPPMLQDAYGRVMGTGQTAPSAGFTPGGAAAPAAPPGMAAFNPGAAAQAEAARQQAMAHPVFAPQPPVNLAAPPPPVNSFVSEPIPGQPVPPAANPNAPIGMAPMSGFMQGSFLDSHPVASVLRRAGIPDEILMQTFGGGVG